MEAIYRYSEETFGTYQAEAYSEGLNRTLQLLADFPRMGRSAEDLRPGLFRLGYQSHMIFYTIEPDYIMIRRVLHARMNFAARI